MNTDSGEAGSSTQNTSLTSSEVKAVPDGNCGEQNSGSDDKRKEENYISRGGGGGNRGLVRGHKRRDRMTRTRRWRGNADGLPFLHGGNIKDPLNLESVKPEEECESYEPLEIVIPKNPRDPLNLKKIIKNRNKRKRRNSKLYGEDSSAVTGESTCSPLQVGLTGSGAEDKPAPDPIVSPVPASFVRKFNHKQSVRQKAELDDKERRRVIENDGKVEVAGKVLSAPGEKQDNEAEMKAAKERKVKKNEKFRYGNFSRYYGFRIGQGSVKDPRLIAFKKEWFEKKTVLDIGCNVGYITLWIAKEFLPRYILGIDIDQHLIGVARKNIRHYCDENIQIEGKFPASFANHYGPISAPPTIFSSKFPDNVWFRQENYVLEFDEYLDSVKQEFDVILALSITKWIHLNWGDSGMKRFFKRIFLHLRPGGKLFLEPQDYESYYRRAKMTADMMENYKKLKFLPNSFKDYLLNEIGFESCEELDVPKAKSKGFDRPIQVYKKKLQFFERKENSDGTKTDQPTSAINLQPTEVNNSQEGPRSPKRAKHIKFDE